jgi:hypothetical protein
MCLHSAAMIRSRPGQEMRQTNAYALNRPGSRTLFKSRVNQQEIFERTANHAVLHGLGLLVNAEDGTCNRATM